MVLQENPNDAFYPWAPCGFSLLFLVIKEGHWIFMMTKKSRAPISCPNVEGNYAWGQRSSLPRSACEVHWPSRPRILGRWPRVICWACTFQNPTDRVHPCFLGSSVQPHIHEYIYIYICIYIYIYAYIYIERERESYYILRVQDMAGNLAEVPSADGCFACHEIFSADSTHVTNQLQAGTGGPEKHAMLRQIQ